MILKEIMTSDVVVTHPDESLETAARKMRDYDIGLLPVCEGDRVVGVLSDRDIVTRATAEGVGPRAIIGRELITTPVVFCYEDQDVKEAVDMMGEHQVRRMIVLKRKGDGLAGIVSFADLTGHIGDKKSGKVLQEVSEPAASAR